MPDDHSKMTEARDALMSKLGTTRAGMLGIEGAHGHMRPMTHFVDETDGIIWFITSREADLAAEVGQGGTAHYCVVDDADGFYACLSGAITQSTDADKLDELWNVVASAYFKGRDDPDLLLLKLALRDAEVWRSTDSGFQFGVEIAKANIDPERTPDVGEHDNITF